MYPADAPLPDLEKSSFLSPGLLPFQEIGTKKYCRSVPSSINGIAIGSISHFLGKSKPANRYIALKAFKSTIKVNCWRFPTLHVSRLRLRFILEDNHKFYIDQYTG